MSSYAQPMRKDDARACWVATGSFVMLLLMHGMFKSLAVLLPALQEEFSTTTWVIGLIISLAQAFGAIICKVFHSSYPLDIAF